MRRRQPTALRPAPDVEIHGGGGAVPGVRRLRPLTPQAPAARGRYRAVARFGAPDARTPSMPVPARSPLATLRRWLHAHPLHSLHTRHKFALLAVVGVAMVVTPLVDVVRRQAADLQTLLGARAGLEPLARALDVQRALIVHRAAAALVLGGHVDAEPQRRARETEVDARLGALSDTLARGHYALALEEDAALRADWTALVERIVARRIDARGSDASHRLLIEQVLQVMDLVGDAAGAPPSGMAASALREPRRAVLFALALAELESVRPDATAAALALARERLQMAARGLAGAGTATAAPGPAAALTRTHDTVRNALASYLAALDAGEAAQLERAAARLNDAAGDWPQRALATLEAELADEQASITTQRATLLGLLAALALVQIVLVASSWRHLAAADPRALRDALARARERRDGSESRLPAEQLLHRLRDARREPREEAPPSQL